MRERESFPTSSSTFRASQVSVWVLRLRLRRISSSASSRAAPIPLQPVKKLFFSQKQRGLCLTFFRGSGMTRNAVKLHNDTPDYTGDYL